MEELLRGRESKVRGVGVSRDSKGGRCERASARRRGISSPTIEQSVRCSLLSTLPPLRISSENLNVSSGIGSCGCPS